MKTLQEPTSQNSPLSQNSCLFCYEDELYWTDNNDDLEEQQNDSSFLQDEEDHLISLLSKEKNTNLSGFDLDSSKSLMQARIEALKWIFRVTAHHNFSAVTLVLCVSYFDKFILSVGFQRERPWMMQLAAVACLSLASKFEETDVPHLLDFQVDCKYIFEAETIKRMELLILSTLEWKMNAVTPLSYFGILIRKLKINNHHHWEILCRCETSIISAISDSRFLQYVPSVLAAAAMTQTLKELELWNPIQHQTHLNDTFKLNKDKLEECCKFIQEISNNSDKGHKRKYCNSGDISPSTVLDIGFSDCSEKPISLLLSPQHVPKKSRTLQSHS